MSGPGKRPKRRHMVTAGLPRATAYWRFGRRRCPQLPAKLPVPWINGPSVRACGDWHSFRDGALEVAHRRGCVICGEIVDGPMYLAAMSGREKTSGMGGHGPCILLAVMRCPHMVEVREGNPDATVAWRYDGPGPGCDLPPVGDDDSDWGGGERIDPDAVPLTLEQLRADLRADLRAR